MKFNLYLSLILLFYSATSAATYKSLYETGFDRLDHVHQLEPKNKIFSHLKRKQRGVFAKYLPQYPLWSDGSIKKRWVYIPKRAQIDTRDPDNWVFPTGTKFWKEFAFEENGSLRKIETRLMEKTADDSWIMLTFVWNEAQTNAVLAPEAGIKNHYELANGKFYDIPSQHDCEYCHSKAGIDNGPQKTPVLGFSALQLSDDRDPNAIHGEPLTKGMMTLLALQKRKIVSHKMDYLPAIAESEYAPLQRSVFGYLHGNCGHCHNESGLAEFTNTLNFNHKATARFIQQNGTYKTAIAKPITAYLQPAGSPTLVINPGHAADSALIYRMTEEFEQYTFHVPDWHHSAGFSLTLGVKMPFVGTNVIDQTAIDVITEYINNL